MIFWKTNPCEKYRAHSRISHSLHQDLYTIPDTTNPSAVLCQSSYINKSLHHSSHCMACKMRGSVLEMDALSIHETINISLPRLDLAVHSVLSKCWAYISLSTTYWFQNCCPVMASHTSTLPYLKWNWQDIAATPNNHIVSSDTDSITECI